MDFQMQRMTSAFIDHFGFNDEEFGEQEESVKYVSLLGSRGSAV